MRTLDELGISPAPWRVGIGDHSQLIYDRNDAYFAFLYSARDIAANARLIAAAPMLYEALRDIMTCWGDGVFDEGGMMCEIEDSSHCGRCDPKGCPIYRKARAALAAASGESEEGETK